MADEKTTGIDWDYVRSELDSEEWQPSDDGFGYERRVFLGTVFSLYPSGKYYTPWANSNVTEAEAEQDEEFGETLEAEASERDLWITSGEGDPCDIFAGESCDELPEDDAAPSED